MEDQLVQLLRDTTSPAEGPRKQAEINLKLARSEPAFPLCLANIAAHTAVNTDIRQSALSVLRNFIEHNWSEDDGDGDGPQIPISDATKDQLRPKLLQLAISDEDQRLVKAAVSYAVGKIANVDFPEQWPALLPTLLEVIPTGTDNQLYGALKVLADLVDQSLSDDQFFSMARDIVNVVYHVTLDENRRPVLRALAVSVFRGCFDLMDIVKEDYKKEVKAFADEALKGWLPFFLQVMKSPLPELPANSVGQPESWNGIIALKLQVVKTLIKIRSVFPQLLLPQSPAFFQATWEELSVLQVAYQQQYLDNDAQGRLEDSDGLPYTLDFLVLEELDFLNQCLRAPPVQKELEAQLNAHGAAHQTPWMLDLMKLVVSFARITREEEDLWDIDVSLYLAEETSVTANYVARTACGDLLIKLGEWLQQRALEGLFAHTKTLFTGDAADWRSQEASLYMFNMLVSDFQDCEKPVPNEIAQAYLELVTFAIGRRDQPLLQARGYLVAGMLAQGFPPAVGLLDRTIESITRDESELVQVACIKAAEGFVKSGSVPADRQVPIIVAIDGFLSSKGPEDLEDADDLLVTLAESLRATISMDYRITVASDIKSIDLLFTIAHRGSSNFQVTMLICEAFEEIVASLSDSASYAALCAKVLPTLIGALNVGDMTNNENLFTLVTELLEVLVKDGSEPLPAGFVATIMPKLSKLLMSTAEGEILRPGAEAIKHMLSHDHQQVFSWQDEQGKSGLEVCLHIIDRLLGPDIEDNAASEVGGLAAELVEKAGQERLGPYLLQLLQAVATRLASADAAPFIQSLIIVFARLSLVGNQAQDVVQFLDGIEIHGQKGLQVVLSKWLENSISFAGYDEIRQNVIALSKIYSLNDERVAKTTVKGDLILTNTDKILTRSRSKLNPDQYTTIPAPLKILKVLVEELLSASGIQAASYAAAAAAAEFADAEEDDGDDGWEDDEDALDLSLGATRADLMSYIEGSGARLRDDETQQYLTEFFLRAARENIAGFQGWYNQLTTDEQAKLNELAAQ